MNSIIFLGVSTVMVLAISLFSQPQANHATEAFKRLQSLTGDWQGKDEQGDEVKSNFKLMISNTVVMETLNASGMEEMLTLYSVDGNGISLLHYCPTNNQPHMRAIPSLGHVNQLIFSFIVGRTITAGFKRRELPQDTRKESNPHFAKDTVRGPARASDCIPVRPGGTPPNARRQEESSAPAD